MSFESAAEVFFPEESESLPPDVSNPDDERHVGDVHPGQEIILEGSAFHEDLGVLEAADQDEELSEDEFTSVRSLSLDQLPASIRSEANLKFIRDISRRVVCVNNNALSPERPPAFRFPEQGSLRGSGIIFFIEGDVVVVSTNRHVLYNDEEVKSSTIDLFFDRPMLEAYKAKEIMRVQRGRGLGTMRANKEEDFTLALFRLDKELVDHLKNLTEQDGGLPYTLMSNKRAFPELFKQVPQTQYGHTAEKILCVIGHPLGKHKRVSFGRIVEEIPASRQFKHDAPTRCGSSGSPILVFSPSPSAVPPNSVWYHIGRTFPGSEVRMAHLQVNDSQLFDVDMVNDERFQLDFLSDTLDYRLLSVDLVANWLQADEFTRAVSLGSAIKRILSLGMCLSAALQVPGAMEVRKVKDHFWSPLQNAIASQAAILQSSTPMADLSTRIDEAQGSCHCPSLVDAVTSRPAGPQSSKSEEILLPPQTTPRGLRHRKTWPFGPDAKLSSRTGHGDGGGRCIEEDIVKDLRQQDPNDKFIFAYYLILFVRVLEIMRAAEEADPDVAHPGSFPSTSSLEMEHSGSQPSAPHGMAGANVGVMKPSLGLVEFGLSLYDAAAMHIILFGKQFLKVSEQIASLSSQVSRSSEDEDVCSRSGQASPCSTGDSAGGFQTSTQRTANICPLTSEEQEAQEDVSVLLNHAHVHYSQSRRDTKGEGGNTRGCSCGRPNPRNLADAARHIRELLEKKAATRQREEEEQSCGASRDQDESPATRNAKRGVSASTNVDHEDEEDAEKKQCNEAGKGGGGGRGAAGPSASRKFRETVGPAFREVLVRLKGQLLLAIMASYFVDAGSKPEQDAGAQLDFIQRLSINDDIEDPLRFLTETLNTAKASLSSIVAYYCLQQSQRAPQAAAEAGITPEVARSVREKLRDGLLFSRRFLAAVEVFLYNSRILLQRWHRDLGCECGHFLDLQSECSPGSSGQESEASLGRETTAGDASVAGGQGKPDSRKGKIEAEEKKRCSGGPNLADVIQGVVSAAGIDLGPLCSLLGNVPQPQTSRASSSKEAMDIDLD